MRAQLLLRSSPLATAAASHCGDAAEGGKKKQTKLKKTNPQPHPDNLTTRADDIYATPYARAREIKDKARNKRGGRALSPCRCAPVHLCLLSCSEAAAPCVQVSLFCLAFIQPSDFYGQRSAGKLHRILAAS